MSVYIFICTISKGLFQRGPKCRLYFRLTSKTQKIELSRISLCSSPRRRVSYCKYKFSISIWYIHCMYSLKRFFCFVSVRSNENQINGVLRLFQFCHHHHSSHSTMTDSKTKLTFFSLNRIKSEQLNQRAKLVLYLSYIGRRNSCSQFLIQYHKRKCIDVCVQMCGVWYVCVEVQCSSDPTQTILILILFFV